jgi:hypothetical protein
LQTHRVAAPVAKRHYVLVEGPANMTEHVARVERVRLDGGAAGFTDAAEMVESFKIAALALPVADGIIDKSEFTQASKILNRKNGSEDALKPGIVAFIRQKVHLEKLFIRLLLHFDEIRNRDRGPDSRKVHALAGGAITLIHVPLLGSCLTQPQDLLSETCRWHGRAR